MIPWPLGLVSSLFTNNSKKWRDMGKQLEVPATLFFWWLGVEISFLPTMRNHHIGGHGDQIWEAIMNKIIVSIFIGVTLNFVEKIIIQLIAISFHLRTYADRIELNKFQIGSLTKLYSYSKEKIAMEDSDFEEGGISGPASGTRTPAQYVVEKAQKNVTEAFNKIGDAAGKVAGDFTGRQITKSTHPHSVVLMLLNSTAGSQVLARRLYRTFANQKAQTVSSDDLKHAFDNDEEAEAAFSMFDKDLNGDISMEELEAVCVEIGRERKSITASLKDLDSVVSKLDNILLFIVVIVTILIFITIISSSAASVLTSAGSSVLALSWLFSATAQEFLQSVIFVFVKHPFDVGDRVTIYGNTGTNMKGDDYFVKEISLLFTEFKKMEGHIVQAPNNYLNTLFILNVRRSGGLAEAVPLTVKFGTTLEQVDQLRHRLLEFVTAEKREYQGNILTEIREVVEAHSLNLNIVFFYKSNWQNELLRLQRRNKFICAMMVSMQEIGIEGPRMRIPGQKVDVPIYIQKSGPRPMEQSIEQGPGPQSGSLSRETAFVPNAADLPGTRYNHSVLRHHSSTSRVSRVRGESLSAMNKRVDFSLGMKDVSSGDILGDIYEAREKPRVPIFSKVATSRSRATENRIAEEEDTRDVARLNRTISNASNHSSRFGLHRASTESQSRLTHSHTSTHRNRFFGSKQIKHDLHGADEDLMEQGMADIPESGPGSGRLDPRSGTVSPRAVKTDSQTSVVDVGSPVAGLPSWEVGSGRNLTRSQTEDFEMRKLRK